jgi:hypothetical protein
MAAGGDDHACRWQTRGGLRLMTTYLIHCYKCSGADHLVDQIDPGHVCQKCKSPPDSYEVDGQVFCWLHQVRMRPYLAPMNFIFSEYVWRGSERQFPNAKLFESRTEPGAVEMQYCEECQVRYESWLDRWVAEESRGR